MAAEDFFTRWSRPRKQNPNEEKGSDTADVANALRPAVPADAPSQSLPTMEDVSGLTRDSDYSRFIAHGVDEGVKRSAMKKLFSDPHYNIMDGLDTYIGDYHSFEPIPSDMLRALNHAKTLLDPLGQLERPLLELIGKAAGAHEVAPAGTAIQDQDSGSAMQAPRPDASMQAAGAAEHETADPDALREQQVGAALTGSIPDTSSSPDDLARVRT